MKRISIIALLFCATIFNSTKAQTFFNVYLDTFGVVKHIPLLEKNKEGYGFKNYYRLMVGNRALYIDRDSNLVINDSGQAIRILLFNVLQLMDENNKLYKKLYETKSTDFIISSNGVMMDTALTHTIYLKNGNVTYRSNNPLTLTTDINHNVILK